MSELKLIATSSFGLEAVVKRELIDLGFTDLEVENGKVTFNADESGIPKANLWLRSADRVLLRLGEFKAVTFDELFEKTKELPWDEWITEDGEFIVNGKSVKSRLFSISDCQKIVKKAVVEKLKSKYKTEWFKETGPKYTIQVSILKDIATLTIDTSGEGLHKRGYRLTSVKAPLRETLAAALIQLSFWNKEKALLDPFCGSGTIPIEAALIGKNIAPGLNRKFASEEWPRIDKGLWKKAKVEALKAIRQDTELKIFASDIDKEAIDIAKENAFNAGVDDVVNFKVRKLSAINIKDQFGVVICNPPYGERLGEVEEVRKLYKMMGQYFKDIRTWSKYIITSFDDFEKVYGRKADRKRKLYNGRIQTNYYQYYGPKPQKKDIKN